MFFGGNIVFGLIKILLYVWLKLCIIFCVCFNIGFWFFLIGIKFVWKVVILVVCEMGYIKNFVGIFFLNFFCLIFVLIVGFWWICDVVIKFR